MMKRKVIWFIVGGIALVCGLPIIWAGVFAVESGHYGRLLNVAETNLKGGAVLIALAFVGYGIWLLISSIFKK
ncbi:MAG: hypothetical protein F4Z55_00870 [Boseongicola sp. SB0667_bin_21]|nr:hypothetical protein [Boseongicola sp. SB0667_bin_21]